MSRVNMSHIHRCHFLSFDTEAIDQVRGIYIVACSLDAILLLPTIICNVLLIISLHRSTELQKPCTKLLYSLAVSDVLVGMVIEPAYFVKKVAELDHSFQSYCHAGMVTYVGGALTSVSFFNLTAIAVDRYLVVHSGTKYRTTVTNTRVMCLILAIWSSAAILITTQFYVTRGVYFKAGAAIMIACVAMASLCYIKCILTLRKQRQVINTLLRNPCQQTSTRACRYNKSTYTMLCIYVGFIICYLPFICTAITTGILGESAAIWGAESISAVIIYTNSLINPLILFWRMKEIRRAVSITISAARSAVYHSTHDTIGHGEAQANNLHTKSSHATTNQ